MYPTSTQLKQAILDLSEPIKLQNFHEDVPGEKNPEFLRWGPEKFVEMLGDKIMPFRTGYNARTCEPQWEAQCSIDEMKFPEFIETTKSTEDPLWRYFDYKYMHQWFDAKKDFLNLIEWKRFGFEKNGNDSTLWIGGKKAHTNCHQDSYGCNLVAQLHGRKQWLLFPPDAGNAMRPTRIPYEESTIYSKFNFFSPTLDDEEGIMKIEKKPRLVVLAPGDVLLVPHGWWHYVESLDFSISVNVWLEIEEDYKERIKEALVKLLVTKISHEVPTIDENETECSGEEAMKLIKLCVDEYRKQSEAVDHSPGSKKLRATLWTAQELAKEFPGCVQVLPELSREKLRELLRNNRERFPETQALDIRSYQDEKKAASLDIINALCNNEIMNKVCNLLLEDV